MYNLADEGVQFSPTQLFNQTRRGCSTSNVQGVQLGRYIHTERDAFSYGFRMGVRLMAEAFRLPVGEDE